MRRRRPLTATLDGDPIRVAAALQSLAVLRGSLRSVGVRMPAGRAATPADAETLDGALTRFEPT